MAVSIEQKIFSFLVFLEFLEFFTAVFFFFLLISLPVLFPHLVSSPPSSSFDFTRTTPKTDLNLKQKGNGTWNEKLHAFLFLVIFLENFLGNQKKIFTEKDLSQMFNCQTNIQSIECHPAISD